MGLELVTSGKNLPEEINVVIEIPKDCLLYTSPSPRDS